jgi:hypothetical protein
VTVNVARPMLCLQGGRDSIWQLVFYMTDTRVQPTYQSDHNQYQAHEYKEQADATPRSDAQELSDKPCQQASRGE